MKIVVLGTRGFPDVQGGVEKHCENLYPRLAVKGCEVVVFGRKPYLDKGDSPQKSETAPFIYEGVKIVALACPKNKFLEAFVHTFFGIFAAKKINPDILHIHAVGPALFMPLARLLGLKTVMTHHGPDYLRKKWNKFAKMILRLGESFGTRWADEVICVSEAAADNIRKKYKRDVTVIPNGVVIPGFISGEDVLKEYGLEKRKYILAVGRFVPEKGFGDLVDAYVRFQGMRDEGRRTKNDWKLVIAGKADHEDKYSRELKELAGKSKDIILTGFITGRPLQELYSHAGLFVLPSYYEGLPIVLLEAMSYGLSCIASDIPANREVGLIADRYFKPNDVEAIVFKIRDFMEMGGLSEAERREQLRIISEKYNWEQIAEQTLEIYNKIKL